jgi:magnesium-protoporphyrin O-methyltransferase
MSCSQCAGIERQFDEATARKNLRRFQRRGPDRTTRLLIEALHAALDEDDARDALLLDIGAGVGAIHHALLDGRVARAVHVDASPAHLAAAREETDRRGHGARVEFVAGDFVEVADRTPPAEVVTLDRVICCYHDMPRLVSLSAARATRLYGAVYPRAVGWMRVGMAAINLWQRVSRSTFRVFLHDPAAIDAVLSEAGLHRRSTSKTPGWEVVVYARRPTATA